MCVKLWKIVHWPKRGLHTKSWPPAIPRTLLKVFGGWYWFSRVSLVFVFGPKPQLKFGPSWTILKRKFYGNKLILPPTAIEVPRPTQQIKEEMAKRYFILKSKITCTEWCCIFFISRILKTFFQTLWFHTNLYLRIIFLKKIKFRRLLSHLKYFEVF